MPTWLQTALAALGALAAIVTILRGGVWLWERLVSRLIVQTWWELTLNPVSRKRFRKSLSVGVALQDIPAGIDRRLDRHKELVKNWSENKGEIWRHLVEPAVPLSVRHFHADGVWALRLLIYNPSGQVVQAGEIKKIDLTIPTTGAIRVLSWQFDDGRLTSERTWNPATQSVTYEIHLPEGLRPKEKVREELVVIFDSHGERAPEPPKEAVQVTTHLRSKVKPYRPSGTTSEAEVKAIGRALARVVPFA